MDGWECKGVWEGDEGTPQVFWGGTTSGTVGLSFA